jgi:hypothetical protein
VPSVYVEPLVRSMLLILPGQTAPTSLVGFDAFLRRLLPDATSDRAVDVAVRRPARLEGGGGGGPMQDT